LVEAGGEGRLRRRRPKENLFRVGGAKLTKLKRGKEKGRSTWGKERTFPLGTPPGQPQGKGKKNEAKQYSAHFNWM